MSDPTEALADAWASIDGKARLFRSGKGKPLDSRAGDCFTGYLFDAQELRNRLRKRGFVLSPAPPQRGLGRHLKAVT